MKNTNIVNIILILFSFLVFTACNNEKKMDENKGFIHAFKEQVKVVVNNKDMVVNITELTNFGWENLVILTPYTTENQINELLGFSWEEAKKTQISYDDTKNVLVFLNEKNEVVNYFEIPRSYGDFSSIDQKNYQNNEAKFTVKVKKEGASDGKDWYYLKELD